MSAKWPKVKLGEVLHYRKEFITIDDLRVYKRPRVKLHVQGIVLRDEVFGTAIKTKQQQVCNAGEFLVAEIDAKVGGFGIVPPELDGAIVSSHYFLFVVKNKNWIAVFLTGLFKHPPSVTRLKAQGSTNYAAIRPSDVLRYEIPLPPLAEQQRMVARIEELAAQIDEANGLQKQAFHDRVALVHACVERNYQVLGSRLGYSRLADVCSTITDGVHQTPQFYESGIRFIFVGNVSSGYLHFNGSKYVSEQYFESLKPQRLPERGDILYSAVGATLGIPALGR